MNIVKRFYNKHVGVSVFLQIVILVLVTMALGVLIYTGATGLMSNWFVNKQVMVTGVYSIGNDVYISIRNAGNVPVNITLVTIYDVQGTLLGSYSPNNILNPGEGITIKINTTGAVNVGDTIDIYIELENGESTKIRSVLQ